MNDTARPDNQPDPTDPQGLRPWLRALLLGLTFSILMVLCNAPVDLWWVGLVAPAPLVWLAMNPKMAPSRAGFWAAIGVAPWWVFTHTWVASVSAAGVVPLVIYLSLWTMLFVWIGGRVASRWPGLRVLLVPVVWVGLEYLRGSVLFSGYAWFLAGHPMIESPGSGLAHPAAWGGAYLVSWLVLNGVCATTIIMRGSTTRLESWLSKPCQLLWLFWLALGIGVWSSQDDSSGTSLNVAVVQTNVPQSNKTGWTFTQRYLDWLDLRDLTIEAATTEPPPDLIVWPETMFPGLTLDPESVQEEDRAKLAWPIERETDSRLDEVGDLIGATTIAYELLALQRTLGIPLMVGAPGFAGLEISTGLDGRFGFEWDSQFNSVFLIRDGQVDDTSYNKMRLMAFGEVMPYISRWPWLEQQLLSIGAEGMSFTLSPGDQPTRFSLSDTVQAATPICFEATMPSICRSLVFQDGQRRAGVMINPSNDGWFGSSVAMREHYLRSSRWRCVELATPMVRACNTGISVAIDARGRILPDSTGSVLGVEALTSGVLHVEIPLGQGSTLYSRFGDAFGVLCLGATTILVGIIVVGGRIDRRKVRVLVEVELED